MLELLLYFLVGGFVSQFSIWWFGIDRNEASSDGDKLLNKSMICLLVPFIWPVLVVSYLIPAIVVAGIKKLIRVLEERRAKNRKPHDSNTPYR